jgi:hypothetical protein
MIGEGIIFFGYAAKLDIQKCIMEMSRKKTMQYWSTNHHLDEDDLERKSPRSAHSELNTRPCIICNSTDDRRSKLSFDLPMPTMASWVDHALMS